MTSRELYRKLVDLYAGDELPEEMIEELRWAALGDPELDLDMTSLKLAVSAIRAAEPAVYDAEADERIKRRIQSGGAIDFVQRAPSHLQYRLPMQG